MILSLLLSVAVADADPWLLPERPEAPDPVDGECLSAQGLSEGDRALCDGVLIPTSEAVLALQLNRHLERVEDVVALREQAHLLEIESLEGRVDFYAHQLSQPERWIDRPQSRFLVGIGTGVALTLGVAWGWGQMASAVID
tara:strand:- start:728 stop:1150 length:423 start_codon:yes stop_codon:yes gene_type:complete